MTNASRFNALTLVDSAGQEISGLTDRDTLTAEYAGTFDGETENAAAPGFHNRLVALVILTVTCTTAAIVAGSYALWLSRHSVAREALSDVNAILKSCQDRMQRMEEDFQQQSVGAKS